MTTHTRKSLNFKSLFPIGFLLFQLFSVNAVHAQERWLNLNGSPTFPCSLNNIAPECDFRGLDTSVFGKSVSPNVFSKKSIKYSSFFGWGTEISGMIPSPKCLNFDGASMRGVDFRGANLQCASFKNTDLTGADFSFANINYVDFSGASIAQAKFVKADMRNSKLLSALSQSQADFTGADLTNSDYAAIILAADSSGTPVSLNTGAKILGQVFRIGGGKCTSGDLVHFSVMPENSKCPPVYGDAFITSEIERIYNDLLLKTNSYQQMSQPTDTTMNGCTDPAYVNYDPAANTDDGSCVSAEACASPLMDGYSYSVVEIDNQCWFAENLRTTVYADGTEIPWVRPENTGVTEWAGLSTGARSEFWNHFLQSGRVDTYGRLYNWYAVERGLCPAGWHVPTDGEWTDLVEYISAQGFSGTEGHALKATSTWYSSVNGKDGFGFSALAGGYRSNEGTYKTGSGQFAGWWSSTALFNTFSPAQCKLVGPDVCNQGYYRAMSDIEPTFGRGWYPVTYGFSVRCLRD